MNGIEGQMDDGNIIEIAPGLLEKSLKEFGEDDIALKLSSISQDDMEKIKAIGLKYASTGMIFAKAFSLAAVEVIEGNCRELKRKKMKGK